MLNPILYRALQSRFGSVRVTNEGVPREEAVVGGVHDVRSRGEHYQVCCPFCDDDKHRLSFSYQYMRSTIAAPGLKTTLVNCYNEHCEEVYEGPFVDDMSRRVRSVRAGSLLDAAPLPEARVNVKRRIGLPPNTVPVDDLPPDHPARVFLRSKYPGLPEKYLLKFGLLWCEDDCMRYTKSGRRIIFPVYGEGGKLVCWQGRTVVDALPRWYNPPGFSKEHIYNFWDVDPLNVPVVAEGIPSALACGPSAVAVYGLSLTSRMFDMIAERFRSIILALDPDAYVPDNRPGGKGVVHYEVLREAFARSIKGEIKTIRWPSDVMEAAAAYNNGLTTKKPPDAADLGIKVMHRLIKNAI